MILRSKTPLLPLRTNELGFDMVQGYLIERPNTNLEVLPSYYDFVYTSKRV